ncbi:MAG: hypothetical protein LLG06_11765 [Desulfobacteraceae bacterium]|nr:hypothetical protein [Desulfobacteraceae bacterium]
MARLQFKGLRNPLPGSDPDLATANIQGIGKVKVGEAFTVNEARAQELLAKKKLIFVRVEKKGEANPKKESPATPDPETGGEDSADTTLDPETGGE